MKCIDKLYNGFLMLIGFLFVIVLIENLLIIKQRKYIRTLENNYVVRVERLEREIDSLQNLLIRNEEKLDRIRMLLLGIDLVLTYKKEEGGYKYTPQPVDSSQE